MTRIKEALTRKFGPLPAWAWLLMLFGAVYYYRKHYGTAATTTASTPTATTNTGSDQPPITLDPGQSVYDPGTGALTTAPGGGGSTDATGGGGTGGGGGLPAGSGPADTTLPATQPPFVVRIINGAKPNTHKPVKPKHGVKRPNPVKKPGRARSTTAINHKSHSPSGGKAKPSVRSRVVTRIGGSHVAGAPRQRPKMPVTRPVVRQRPVASASPSPAHQPAPHNPPRPSAPPPRNVSRRRHH